MNELLGDSSRLHQTYIQPASDKRIADTDARCAGANDAYVGFNDLIARVFIELYKHVLSIRPAR